MSSTTTGTTTRTVTDALRIGTRASALAMSQTRTVADAIAKASGLKVELVPVTTHGDTSSASLSTLGGTGAFAGALRQALIAGDCDLLVHSMKDLPTAPFPGIVVGAVPRRADARDALCARDRLTIETLPAGARVGTGSPRRIAQLRAHRPDLEVVDIRGNVDTRLARVFGTSDPEGAPTGGTAPPVSGTGPDLDGVILAAAGLTRLSRANAITDLFGLAAWPTAPGQGALAIEVREGAEIGRTPLALALASVTHASTVAETLAERTVLARLEAGCAAPIGATALIDDGMLFLTATVYSLDGTRRLDSSHAATLESNSARDKTDAALDVAARVADELLAAGAADLAPLGDSAG